MSTDSSKEYLISCKEKFDSFFKAVAIYVSRFQQVTLDCCKRIEKCSGNISFITHYVIDWFKLYLGVKDELGVIITGEIVREYHKNLHRLYIHDRGHENTYFNGPLSACSKDGMQYEWRLLTDKYGNKKFLNRIVDDVDIKAESLQAYAKSIDEDAFTMKKTLLKVGMAAVDITLTHKTENIKVFVNKGCQPIQVARKDLPRSTRAEALRTSIEDPPDAIFNQSHRIATKDLITTNASNQSDSLSVVTSRQEVHKLEATKGPKKRGLKTIVDSDDDDSLNPTSLVPVAVVKPAVDFGLNISLKDIKKSYGVNESDSEAESEGDRVTEEPLWNKNVLNDVNLDSNVDRRSHSTAVSTGKHKQPAFTVRPLFNQVNCIPPLELMRLTVRSNNSEIKTTRIEISWSPSLTIFKKPANFDGMIVHISVDDLLTSIANKYWMTLMVSTQERDPYAYATLPKSILFKGTTYKRGQLLAISVKEASSEFVTVMSYDDQDQSNAFQTRLFCKNVAKKIFFLKSDIPIQKYSEKDLIPPTMPEKFGLVLSLIQRCCVYIELFCDYRDRATIVDEVPSVDPYLDFSGLSNCLMDSASYISSILLCLDSALNTSHGSSSGESNNMDTNGQPQPSSTCTVSLQHSINIALRYSEVDSRIIAALLYRCSNVDLSLSNVTSELLSEASRVLSTRIIASPCQSINLSFNRLLFFHESPLWSDAEIQQLEIIIEKIIPLMKKKIQGLIEDSTMKSVTNCSNKYIFDFPELSDLDKQFLQEVLRVSYWLQFCTSLLGELPLLQQFDFSHCCNHDRDRRLMNTGILLGIMKRAILRINSGSSTGQSVISSISLRGFPKSDDRISRIFQEYMNLICGCNIIVDLSGPLLIV